MKRSWSVLSLLVVACAPPVTDSPEPAVATVAVQTVMSTAPMSTVTTSETPSTLSVLNGTALVGLRSDVQVLSGATFKTLPVGGPGESTTLGSVQQLVTRGNGGTFVVSSLGLFHDATGRLLRSPLTDELGMTAVSTLDALGSGDAEELWLAMASGAKHWKQGTARTVSVAFRDLATTKPEALLAPSADKAVYAAADQLFLVDVGSDTVTWLATRTGAVRDWARFGDSLVIVTSTSLFKVSASGVVSKLDITNPRAVASGAALWLATDTAVGTLDDTTFTIKNQVTGVKAHGLAVDAVNAAWVASTSGLVRVGAPVTVVDGGVGTDAGVVTDAGVGTDAGVTTDAGVGAVPTWAADIQPMLMTRCSGCHRYAAQTPADLVTYAYAQAQGELIYTRISDTDPAARMPPQGSPQLTAAQINLFRRWIDGGYAR